MKNEQEDILRIYGNPRNDTPVLSGIIFKAHRQIDLEKREQERKDWHEVIISWEPGDHGYDNYRCFSFAIETWCNAYLTAWEKKGVLRYRFLTLDDAVLFKITWC